MNDKTFIIIGLFLFLLIFSCKKEELKETEPQLYIPETEFEYYFPLQTDSLNERPFVMQEGKLIPDINILYSSLLKNMREPNFLKKKDSGFIVRYSVLPAFEPPYTYRIQNSSHEWILYYKMLAFDEGHIYPFYKEDSIIKDTIIFLRLKQFYKLENYLKKFKISKRATHNVWGHDGEIHILEVYKNGEYHFIHRWSPRREDEAEFMDICKLIEEFYIEKN